MSTAYVHGGRPGVLPETAVAANEPPSLWHPLEPQQGGGGGVGLTSNGGLTNGHVNGHANGHAGGLANGYSNGHSNGHANGHAHGDDTLAEGRGGSRASVPGVYLDLESELAHAQVREDQCRS